jgi:UDP-glucose 4-epimerase
MASKTGFGEIRIFSPDEKKQDGMRGRLKNAAVKFYIGDVRNCDTVLQAMHGVDFVFHAAALKRVPSCEFFPIEAVQMNTLGAEDVMTAALLSMSAGDRAEHRQSGMTPASFCRHRSV